MKSDQKTSEHVVIRVKSDGGFTLDEHHKVMKRYGKVNFAKIGKPLSDSFFGQLSDQINRSIPTFLFIAFYEGKNLPFTFLKSELKGIFRYLTDDELKYVPPYLLTRQSHIQTWFLINKWEKIAPSEIQRIRIFTSGREISSSVRGTTALFRVCINGEADLMTSPYLPPQRSEKSDFFDSFGDADSLCQEDDDFVRSLSDKF